MAGSIELGIDGLTDFEHLGVGGFATVYRATEIDIGRPVAVKVLTAVDEAGRRRFDRERRTLGNTTDHTNIVTLFRSGYTDPGDQPYLVMEYMSRGSLQDRLNTDGPLPWSAAADLILPVADALGFSHGEGIVHRDVKPANILISRTNVVKLSDFGIASILEASAASTLAYSMLFTAPETFQAHLDPETNRLIDPRGPTADLYSLAATLHILATGAPPFQNPTQAGLLSEILTAPVPSVGHQGLDRFFATALAKEPDQRHPDADTFANDLRSALSDLPGDRPGAIRTVVAPTPTSATPPAGADASTTAETTVPPTPEPTAAAPEPTTPTPEPTAAAPTPAPTLAAPTPELPPERTTAVDSPVPTGGRNRGRIALVLAAIAVIVAIAALAAGPLLGSDETPPSATGDGDGDGQSTGGETTDTDDNRGADEPDDTADEAAAVGDLSACPSPLVIQLDWFPSAVTAPLFGLLGDDMVVDPENGTIRAGARHRGQALGFDLEFRSGGTFTAFATMTSLMAEDPGIHLVTISTNGQIAGWDEQPLVAVVAPLERSPIAVVWDPVALPDIGGIEDLRRSGTTINVFAGADAFTVLAAEGVILPEQITEDHDGNPAALITTPDQAIQGFVTNEPYVLDYELTEFDRAPAFQLLADVGWTDYDQTLAVRPGDVDALAPCLAAFVPIIQEAVVDYVSDPDGANERAVAANDGLEEFWVLSLNQLAWAAGMQRNLDVIGNGGDDTLGNVDEDRVETLLDGRRNAGLDSTPSPSQLFTNRFIDPAIGVGG